ncbi:MAG: putative secreted protein [Caulobacter sp.]|nr:putative secreted protein [Caulobacter sp.]
MREEMTSQHRPVRWARRIPALLALAGAVCGLSMLGASPALSQAASGDWAAVWGAPPEPPRDPPTVFNNQTVREVARLSIGAGRVRVRLTNEFGSRPVTITAAHVAVSGPGASIVPATDRTLTFGGRPSVTIPNGASMLSDPVDIPVSPLANVSVSLYFAGSSGESTGHFFGMQMAYVGPGNQTAARDMPNASVLTERPFVAGIEAAVVKKTKVVVTLGDSLTDGYGSTAGANRRWPDALAERLNGRKGTQVAVVNAAISGNRLLHDFIGPNALSRFDRDVLAQPGVTHVIVLLGLNDFGFPGARKLPDEEVSAEDVINGYKQLIARAHAHGIKVVGATIPPFGPIPQRPGFYSDAAMAKRDAVNTWIRTSKAFDSVIDFDAVLRDPKAPNRLLPAYDSGDHLSPNDAGYKAMADAINLKIFD